MQKKRKENVSNCYLDSGRLGRWVITLFLYAVKKVVHFLKCYFLICSQLYTVVFPTCV